MMPDGVTVRHQLVVRVSFGTQESQHIALNSSPGQWFHKEKRRLLIVRIHERGVGSVTKEEWDAAMSQVQIAWARAVTVGMRAPHGSWAWCCDGLISLAALLLRQGHTHTRRRHLGLCSGLRDRGLRGHPRHELGRAVDPRR